MISSVPVVLVAAMDLVGRQAAVGGLLLDRPDAVAVTHDLLDLVGGGLRRVVSDQQGVRYDDHRRLDHACLSCAVREDLVPTLRQLSEDGRWSAVVVGLPVSADPSAVALTLDGATASGDCGRAVLAGVVSVVEPERLVGDLFGDDLLADRGLALGEQDRRSVGEATAHQLEAADAVATTTTATGTPAALIAHLTADATSNSWAEVDADALFARRWDARTVQQRVDPMTVAGRVPAEGDGVWTIDLTSERPFHPGRLQERLEDLALGPLRSRGHFWLPTRPGAICVWDGASGQLSIGNRGGWGHRRPGVALRITGIDAADRARVQDAFAASLATPAELTTRPGWAQEADGFGPWLDEFRPAA